MPGAFTINISSISFTLFGKLQFMKRYCLALDLKNNEQAIAAYEHYHKQVWPEIVESIKVTGIVRMEIYRVFNRLFMIMETTDNFSFQQKAQADTANRIVQEWEALMSSYQQVLPGTPAGEKWVLMEKIFDLR
jgi:L-rhamnose mutarotase